MAQDDYSNLLQSVAAVTHGMYGPPFLIAQRPVVAAVEDAARSVHNHVVWMMRDYVSKGMDPRPEGEDSQATDKAHWIKMVENLIEALMAYQEALSDSLDMTLQMDELRAESTLKEAKQRRTRKSHRR
jgi:hypothetical protein